MHLSDVGAHIFQQDGFTVCHFDVSTALKGTQQRCNVCPDVSFGVVLWNSKVVFPWASVVKESGPFFTGRQDVSDFCVCATMKASCALSQGTEAWRRSARIEDTWWIQTSMWRWSVPRC